MVSMVLHEIDRVRRDLDDDESLDSDATLELHLSEGDINTDTDSEVDLHTVRHSFRSMFQDDTDTDSDDDDDDDDGGTPLGRILELDDIPDSTDYSDTSQSSSSESSDSSDYDF